MIRDVYTEGGQIHMTRRGRHRGRLLGHHRQGRSAGRSTTLLGGRLRDRVRAYANGWYRGERTPETFAERRAEVVARGYKALKFDPFGAAWRIQDPVEEDLSIDIVARRARGGRARTSTS